MIIESSASCSVGPEGSFYSMLTGGSGMELAGSRGSERLKKGWVVKQEGD